MKRDRRKTGGFTLVELIVVLIILAVLAAIMVPALSGWIRRARRTQLIIECRSSVQAAQGLYMEAFGLKQGTDSVTMEQIKELAGVDGTVSSVETDSSTYLVLHLTYTKGEAVTYCRTPETCPLHAEVYNFEEGASGGGEPPTPPAPAGSVTLMDTGGAKHTLKPTHMWDNITGQWNQSFSPGAIISDGTDTYIFANTQEGISTRYANLTAFINANADKFIKLETQTILLTGDLRAGLARGTICWVDGVRYVAVEKTSNSASPAGGTWPWKSF